MERNRDRIGVESDKENDKFFSDVIDFELEKNGVEDRNHVHPQNH